MAVSWVVWESYRSSVYTDAQGNYTLKDIVPGQSGRVVVDPEYIDPKYPFAKRPQAATQWWKGSSSWGGANIVTGAGGGQNVVANFTLTPGATLSGKVLFGGAGLGKVKVEAYLSGDPGKYATVETTTNTDGTWKLSHLGAGTYTLQYTPEQPTNTIFSIWSGGATTQDKATGVVVPSTGTINAGTVSLPSAGSIVGAVGNSGTPFTFNKNGGPKVYLHQPTHPYAELSTQTKPDGTFSFPKLRFGQYTLHYLPLAGDWHREVWYKDKSRNDATPITVGTTTPVRVEQTLQLNSILNGIVRSHLGFVTVCCFPKRC